MSQIGSATTRTLLGLLGAGSGLSAAIAEIAMRENIDVTPIAEAQMFAQDVSFDLAEKGSAFRYPAVYVYCEKVSNRLREKFRRFSGTVRMNVEIRVSQDRLERIQEKLQLYVDGVIQVLDSNRGDWGQGMTYSGAYEILFGTVRRGGTNYIQAAKVVLEVDVSQS